MDSLTAMRRKFSNANDVYDVKLVLRLMGALLSGVADGSMPVRPLHASFYDFLMDCSRAGQYAVEIGEIDLDLGFACVRVMEDGLCFNICKLENSYVLNSQVEDLDVRIQNYISPHLAYACRFWVRHIEGIKFHYGLGKEVEAFFKERILLWMEVLSLLQMMNNAPGYLAGIAEWMKDGFPESSALAKDAIKFMRMFGGMMTQSTPHLYISGLALSPANSALFREFSPKYSKLALIAKGYDEYWPTHQMTLREHTSPVTSVVFSPDGKRIASGSDDNTVCLWDVETGLQLGGPLKGHTSSVTSVAFSPDGKRIASGSDDSTVCLWDVETGLQLGSPLKGHTSSVTSVAFSPDGKRIASGSFDNTICLWDAETGSQLGSPLERHTSSVTSVAFSPDGKRIASGAFDHTIFLWDAETGSQLGSSLEGHTSSVTSVAFSPDGKRIASGSDDNTICLWDAEIGLQLGSPLRGHTSSVTSVAFSPDGERIASGSFDNTICLWDAETGLQLGSPLEGHIYRVNSVAFSPDGKRIASGSDDNTICLWDAEIGLQLGSSLEGHTSSVTSAVAFSPCYSCNQMHALSDANTFLQQTPFHELDYCSLNATGTNGWIVGPEDRHLLWIPPSLLAKHPRMHHPNHVLVMPRNVELNLSRMVHGPRWAECNSV
ncbi:hypothetical protein ID866_9461 [Astraeus odoratus]|nr:hypothetical protein ID866_9461 [Astraeus odoratus]